LRFEQRQSTWIVEPSLGCTHSLTISCSTIVHCMSRQARESRGNESDGLPGRVSSNR
jgi:hypothetical protein